MSDPLCIIDSCCGYCRPGLRPRRDAPAAEGRPTTPTLRRGIPLRSTRVRSRNFASRRVRIGVHPRLDMSFAVPSRREVIVLKTGVPFWSKIRKTRAGFAPPVMRKALVIIEPVAKIRKIRTKIRTFYDAENPCRYWPDSEDSQDSQPIWAWPDSGNGLWCTLLGQRRPAQATDCLAAPWPLWASLRPSAIPDSPNFPISCRRVMISPFTISV
jgi:hypothetical protein